VRRHQHVAEPDPTGGQRLLLHPHVFEGVQAYQVGNRLANFAGGHRFANGRLDERQHGGVRDKAPFPFDPHLGDRRGLRRGG
jgi:hypothetical protein